MADEIRHSTEVTIHVGPIISSETGAVQTGLTIADADIKVAINGTLHDRDNSSDASAVTGVPGLYTIVLSETDTGGLGDDIYIQVALSGSEAWWKELKVVSQSYYDAKYGTDPFPANVTNWAGIDLYDDPAPNVFGDGVWGALREDYTDEGTFGEGVNAYAAVGTFPQDVFDDAVLEGTVTMTQALQAMAAVLAAKASGGGTGTVTYRDLLDTLNRVTATVDGNGNRTGVTLNFS